MTPRSFFRNSLRWSAAGAGLAAAGYAAYVGVTWALYGHAARPTPDEHDQLLDRFLPAYDVVDRYHIRVAAPAAVTLAVAADDRSLRRRRGPCHLQGARDDSPRRTRQPAAAAWAAGRHALDRMGSPGRKAGA